MRTLIRTTLIIERITPAATILIMAMAILACSGCTAQVQRIPLFNPDAKLINKIASANELITEANVQCVQLVRDGVLTQDQVNTTISPAIDRATAIVDEAEALYRVGNPAESENKLESAKAIIKAVRDQLIEIERTRKT